MVGAGEVAKEYAAGFAAGIATVVTGHPFDTVKMKKYFALKTLLSGDTCVTSTLEECPKTAHVAHMEPLEAPEVRQEVKLQVHNTKGQRKVYKNALHCMAWILSNEGVKGLYRGASSSFIGMAFESSLLFGIYSQMSRSLQGKTQSTTPRLQVIIPSAAFGGAIISFILCPSELVKCRMQVQGTGSAISSYTRYSGPLHCALQTIKDEGIQGIYRGGFGTLLRESIGNAVFFSTYEFIRYNIRSQLDSISVGLGSQKKLLVDVGTGIFSGGLAGMAFWTAVLPLDVAKTVIQTAEDRSSSRNPFQTICSINRRVGLRGCYAGLGPTLLRAFPANAAAIVTWEMTAKILGLKHT